MQNLNYLFAKSDETLIPKVSKLLAGQVTLFRRPSSANWQCRFKLANGAWHTASTGTEDSAQAHVQAIAIFETVKVRVGNALAVRVRTFKQLAHDETVNMASAIRNNSGKRVYRDYVFAINKYLIPFFGPYEVGKITPELLADFESWRISEMGRVPVASTKRNHASAYNRIINLARDGGYVGHNQGIPLLDSRGPKSQPRPAFTAEEIEKLRAFMPAWQESSYTDRTEQMRILCSYYIEFLVNTGVRHGTEALGLRWRHLQWHWIGDKKYLRIWVSGKTGPRYLIAKHAVIQVLAELMAWQERPYSSLDDIIQAKLDKPIFCLVTGHVVSNLENIFRNLMVRSGLRQDGAGQNRTLYSLRHSYATFALAGGVDIHTLAKQMGTSVGMIERHYSKLTPMMNAERLA